MYQMYYNGELFYYDRNPDAFYKVISPKLTLEDNSSGSLTMTLPPNTKGYGLIERMSGAITVFRDGAEVWEGRVIDESCDFWNQRVLTCEGSLSFLIDTIQPPAEYHDQTVRGFLETLISIHNEKSKWKFEVGVVTVTDSNDSIYRYTNYETTLDCIMDKLLDRLGGHIRVRKENGVRYIDYLKDYPNTNTQTIEFGKNLLDFAKNYDLTNLATVVVPRGARLEESPIEALDAYLTVADVNGGSIYVYNQEAVDSYGWIVVVVDWDSVTDASNLLQKAKDYLSIAQFESLVLELSAVDLHYLESSIEAIDILDNIRCISKPHGMNRVFPVTKVSIPLDMPENATYTLGTKETNSISKSASKVSSSIIDTVENLGLNKGSLLDEAKRNATAIMKMATNGFITITQDNGGTEALYISDTKDYTKATKLWKWSITGLGYSSDGGDTFDVAITMDGAINGKFIAANSITADKLTVQYITAVDLSTAGKTTINGANIQTGTITADKLTVQYITAVDLSTAGKTTINGANIQTGTITADKLNVQYITSTDLSTAGKTTIHGNNITTGTIGNSAGNTQYNLDEGWIRTGTTSGAHVVVNSTTIRWYIDSNTPTGMFHSIYGRTYIGANSRYVMFGWLPNYTPDFYPGTGGSRDDFCGLYVDNMTSGGLIHCNAGKFEIPGRIECASLSVNGREI